MKTVFVTSDAMDDLLNSGVIPPAVQSSLLAWGHAPYTQAATPKMVEQSIDTPNIYIITVRCIARTGDYPVRVAVAEMGA